MPKRRTTRRRRRRQRGGILPLAALIPAAIAAGKAVALGGISGAAGYEPLYVERSREGPPHRLKNDDSDELSPEAILEVF